MYGLIINGQCRFQIISIDLWHYMMKRFIIAVVPIVLPEFAPDVRAAGSEQRMDKDGFVFFFHRFFYWFQAAIKITFTMTDGPLKIQGNVPVIAELRPELIMSQVSPI
jgi:hypothetical protein